MSIKDILVYVDDGTRNGNHIQATVDVALAYQARLTGIYVVNDPFSRMGVCIDIADDLRQALASAVSEDTERAEKLFRDKVGSCGLATEWHSEDGEMVDVVTRHARYADLVVAAQSDPDSSSYGGHDIPDQVILAVGCPVMIIPRKGSFDGIGRRVLVAWDAGRSAARAVRDAMPFLERAEDVKVVSANIAIEGSEGPATTLCRRLERCGVRAEPRDLIVKGRKRDALLCAAEKEGADLIVMGAYGHSRWQELVLGGVTQHMLSHATIPVLMSH